MHDRQLMHRIRQDDIDALQRLMARHWGVLVDYVARIVREADEAEDVVQQTFLKVWEERASWRSRGRVTGYLHQIARNLALNAQRDLRARRRWEESGAPGYLNAARPPTPSQALEEGAMREEVEAAIDALHPRRREVFVLSRFSGLTYREIASTMGIAPQTVANHMSAALDELRERLGHLAQTV